MSNTITLSFTLWEVALLIIAIAVVIGTVYLVKVFKSLALAMDTANKMMEENRSNVKIIVDKTTDMTETTESILEDVHGTVDSLTNEIITPVVDIVGKGVKVMSGISKVTWKSKKKKAA
ncbi:DUF948 domain-containing protein [Eubacterium aggregans]|uniref:DUF948 domain-containing protein n=1 Tax=Eubacterium aggregans TaxID=81409 RepID=UPI003F3109E6